MRIIAGEYRGRVLKSPSNLKIRPTSDRLRETLFNILNPKISSETSFLDLCAGTGAVGIEAISRGVGFAVFVDKSRKACGLIETNLDALKIPENQTEVICDTAESFVRRKPHQTFDIIYFDPPYKTDYGQILREINSNDLKIMKTGGVFIAEHNTKNNLPDAVGHLRRWRLLKQGESSLSFYEGN
ncbi:MAG: 16S rRNA (guanine(966)-N(2))-methyltransferase RsmD [Pyrinomonadaceae bacterium]